MMWASVLAFVSVGVAYFARNLWLLGFAVLVVGVSSAVFALARHAFMTEHVPLSHRARALSLLGGTFRAGAFIGPLASAGVIAWLGINAVFAFSLVIWVVSAVSLLLTKDERSKLNEETSIRRTFVIAKREGKKLATVGVGAMMVGVLRTTRQVGLPLWALVIGLAPERSTLYIGVAAVVDFALFYTSGQIMDRWGRRWAAVPTTIGLSLTHIFMFVATDEPTFLIFAVLMSLANGLGSGLVLTLGADLAPDDARPEFLAGFRLLVDAGVAAAPPILSAITAVVGLGTGMASFGVVGLGTAWLFYRYIPRFIKSPR
jgi:MFS family permease